MEMDSNPPPRVRRTPEQIKELLVEHEHSEKPALKFATEKGIAVSTLWAWRRRYRTKSPRGPRWIEVANGSANAPSQPMAQVHLVDGLVIDLNAGFEVESIALLIERLRKG